MRTAVVIFYWICAVLLIVISVHAELHREGKPDNKNSAFAYITCASTIARAEAVPPERSSLLP